MVQFEDIQKTFLKEMYLVIFDSVLCKNNTTWGSTEKAEIC